ncbi:MAG TPA: mechanosensitive ion channel family protein [Rhizomicrobium sp.]|jgi:small conductance mechanosensitive channel|nr:mechanosensitive ion channel family protein [Rhizomicrobium sp.]
MALPLPAHAAMTQPAPALVPELQLIVVNGGLRLAVGIVILVVGWMAATWAKRGLEAGLARVPIDLTLKPLIASLARYGILILTVLLVVQQFGVQTTSLIAVLGAAGLAVGLALQGTLSNVASGVMLLVLRPFRVGQFVEIAKGKQGTVREIGLFTTMIITRDGVYVSVPNSSIFGEDIVNFTRERVRRVTFTVPVDWVNDLDLVEKTIADALSANALVLKEPAPSAIVSELQEYAVVMRARAHVRSPDYWRALWSLQKEVKAALDKAKVLTAVTRQAAINRAEPDVPGNRSVEETSSSTAAEAEPFPLHNRRPAS